MKLKEFMSFQVCVKNSFSLNYVITIIQNILSVIDNVKDRHCFFNGIMNMFKELILDLHEFGEQGENYQEFLPDTK